MGTARIFLTCVSMMTLVLTTAGQSLPKLIGVTIPVAQLQANQPGRTLGKQETLTGSITAVDPQTKILTVTGSNGTPYEFRIAGNAKITIDGHLATLVDLTAHINGMASIEFVPTSTGNFVHSIELNSN